MNPADGSIEPSPEASHFRTWIRTWRYLFIFIGLILGVVIFYAEENWRGYHALQSYKQQMAESGRRTEPESFIPPPVPDDQNFAMTPALGPLFEFIPGTQEWRDSNAPHAFEPFMARYDMAAKLVKPSAGVRMNTWVHSSVELEKWAWAFAQGSKRGPHRPAAAELSDETISNSAAKVLEALTDFTPALDELRAASERPYSRFNLQYQEENPASILLPHLARLKQFCQIIGLRSSAEVALNHTEDARADVLLMLSIVNATRSEPVLISQLVRMAELHLTLQPLAEGMGKWSEPQLREFQDRLEKLDFLQDINRTLEAERTLFGGGVIEYMRRSPKKMGDSRVFDDSGITSVGVLLSAAPNGWYYFEQLNYNRLFDRYLLPTIDLTNRLIRPAQVSRMVEALTREISGPPSARLLQHRLFAGLLLPSLSKVSQKAAFSQTAVNLAVIACAVERYRMAHANIPDSPQDLVPQYLQRVPHDVINGQPLLYKKASATDYVLYSVGWNETDDDGTVKQTKSGGIEQNEGDWVWSNRF
jgi:hypothetical protein